MDANLSKAVTEFFVQKHREVCPSPVPPLRI
jgi:hypothetical protein